MKILVTGSAGFIGFHLTKKLIELKHNVTGIDNLNNYYDKSLKISRLKSLENMEYTFHELDINNINVLDDDFDLVIHLAAQAGVRSSVSMIKEYKRSNIEGHEAVLNFCVSRKIKKFIFASSSSVYGSKDKNIFSEKEKKLKPSSYYGETKRINEQFSELIASTKDISILGLRFFSVYGPFGRPDMAYFLFANALKENKEVTLNNRGQMLRDMTYIDDIIHGIVKSINYISNNNVVFEVFNLGNNNPIMTIDLLEAIEKNLGIKAKINHRETQNEDKMTNADLTKSKKLLGYNPKTNFSDGLNFFLKWHSDYMKNEKN